MAKTKALKSPRNNPVTIEDETRVREKLIQSDRYIQELITKELGVFPFKHFASGHNYAIVEDDRDIIAGSGYGKRNVWGYVSKYFSIFNKGGIYESISSSLTIEFKGIVNKTEFNEVGLYTKYSGKEHDYFHYGFKHITNMFEIEINGEFGFDKLLSGDFDSSILYVLRTSLNRYKHELLEDEEGLE